MTTPEPEPTAQTANKQEVKAPCGHAAKYLKYDKLARTIRCMKCLNPPSGLVITEDEAQMDGDCHD